jgi:hypothetical protein
MILEFGTWNLEFPAVLPGASSELTIGPNSKFEGER